MKIDPKIIAIVLAVICVIILAVFFLTKKGVVEQVQLVYRGAKGVVIPGPVIPPAQPAYKPTDQEIVIAKYW